MGFFFFFEEGIFLRYRAKSRCYPLLDCDSYPTSLIVDDMKNKWTMEACIFYSWRRKEDERDYLCRFLFGETFPRKNAFYCETTFFGSSEVLPLPLLGGSTKSRAVNR